MVKKQQLEKPEMLEFLKLSRTLIRQVKQFRMLEMQETERKHVEHGLEKVRDVVDEYLGDE